jgi:Ca-activated chloride channel family protein
MTFRFESPWMLLLLLPLSMAYVVWILRDSGIPGIGRNTRQRSSHAWFSDLDAVASAGLVAARWQPLVVPTTRFIAAALVVLALARPQSGQVFRERTASGVDIVLAIDVSGSMQALDFEVKGERVDRLAMLKSVAAEFIAKRPNDRIGIIAFGSDAFTLCPLTLDHGLLRDYLEELEIGMGGDGTAIGQAVGLVTKRLGAIESKTKLAVLLTDGDNTAGALDPRLAAQIAREKGVKVYTVAIGKEGPVPVAVPGFFGQKRIVQREFPVDLKLLEEIAATTGAVAYRAQDTEQLRDIYDQIDKQEKTELKFKERSRYDEQMHWFAISALIFVFAEAVFAGLRQTRRLE